jgi:CRP-like cAMP-binding protein
MDDLIKHKIADFFAKYPERHFDQGQLLVQANESPSGIFHIVSGQVRQYDISDQGNEIVVNVFKAPAFFPMSWAITNTPNRYFFEAATSLEVHMVPAVDAVDFIKQNPDVMFNLLARLYSGVEGLQRRMAHLMGGTAPTRVAFELVIACKRFGEKQLNNAYSIEINEEELAHRSGMTRETINREVSALKQQGLIAVDHKRIIVKDLQRLEAQLGERL